MTLISSSGFRKATFPMRACSAASASGASSKVRKPHLRITPNLAAQPEAKTVYLRHRAFEDDYYCKLILEYLAEFGSGKRADFERLLENKLSDALSLKQMERKIGNLLQSLRRQGKIETEGIKKAAVWKPASPSKPLKT